MVEWKKLGEVFEIRNGYTPSKNNPDYWENGTIPWFRMEDIRLNGGILSDSIQHITPASIKTSGLFPANTIIVATTATIGEHALVIVDSLANQQFTALISRKSLTQSVLPRFAYYYCFKLDDWCKNHIRQGGFASVDMDGFKKYPFPIPSLSEQNRIVGILDTFTASIDNLKEQIAQRRKQYEYYRDELLDLEGKEGVEMKTIKDVCLKTTNIKWNIVLEGKTYDYIDLSSVDIETHQIGCVTEIEKNNAPSRAQQIVKAGDIILGTTRPTLRRYCIIPVQYDNQICSTGYCIYRANTSFILNRWLFHNIGKTRFWDYCERKQQGAGYPCLSNSDAFAYIIPIPSLSEQQRIVSILDTFEDSIQNLEAQLEQRQKQYEYYRNKLLTFE